MAHASVTTWLECPETGFLADEIVAEVAFDVEWSDPTWPEPSRLVGTNVRIVSAILGRKDCDRELLIEIFGEEALYRADNCKAVADQIIAEVEDAA